MESKNFVIIVALLISSLSFAHIGKTDFKAPRNIMASIQLKNYANGLAKIQKHDIDVAGVDVKSKIVDVIISEAELKELEEEGFEVTVELTKEIMRAPDSEYKNPSEVEELVKDFHKRFPNITQLEEVGKSLEGRTIWGLKISDNPTQRELSEPTILFNSMHHAREIMTTEVSLDIIEYLLTRYDSDAKVKHWVDSNEIYVVPMFNVDGNNIVWTRDNMWRKNARGGYGVDLNRNYPFNWNKCNGSSGSRRSQTYRGPEPASEPETKALMNYVRKIRPVFDISYHSYSELVLYPLGCRNERVRTKEVVEGIGKEMGALLDYAPGTPWELLYSADGGDIDWMYGEMQVIPYVLEVSSRREGFQPSYSRWRDVTVERNRKGWQLLLDKLDGTALRGTVKNFNKIEGGVVVKVYKKSEAGSSLYQEYKVNPDGTFHIVLIPGEYDFEFTAAGRSSQTHNATLGQTRSEIEISL